MRMNHQTIVCKGQVSLWNKPCLLGALLGQEPKVTSLVQFCKITNTTKLRSNKEWAKFVELCGLRIQLYFPKHLKLQYALELHMLYQNIFQPSPFLVILDASKGSSKGTYITKEMPEEAESESLLANEET
eukprot:Gb_04807 [translate_table: standard]